ncbi:MAG: hypothetical protein GF344_15485, partial [Chitinivibrionales bacterium]|nr:hypothetical protein [Chitinivibrionales bacterium]
HHDLLKRFNLLSMDGHCRAFSADGSGWVVGEGVGMVLLRPRTEALRCNDNICALIQGTAVSHCGRTKRYGIPNSDAQAESIREAFKIAAIEPKSVSYIDTQATGSAIADATEIAALTEVFREGNSSECKTIVGSVKPNVGHLESASTISQVIKVLMQMKYGDIAPTVDTDPLNPLLKIEKSPFTIANQPIDWRANLADHQKDIPYRALINSIGATGSMGHMILESDTSRIVQGKTSDIETAVVLSAASEEQLSKMVDQLDKRLNSETKNQIIPALTDIAYTLAVGRSPQCDRLAMVVGTLDELRQTLASMKEHITPDGKKIFRGKAELNSAKVLEEPSSMVEAARLWCQGEVIDWKILFPREAKRVPLPTYPFRKDKHWLFGPTESTAIQPEQEQSYRPFSAADKPHQNEAGDTRNLLHTMENYLVDFFAREIGAPTNAIKPNEPCESFGLDSKFALKLNTALHNARFENLSTTFFFEHRTIHEMASFLLHNHGNEVKNLFRGEQSEEYDEGVESVPAIMETHSIGVARRSRRDGSPSTDDIAIIGMDARFPGAQTVHDYWRILMEGKDLITEVPKERWDGDAVYDPEKLKPGKTCGKWGGFIDGVDTFDYRFFKMSPKEAGRIDPQERLLLQSVWKTVEDAGYTRSADSSITGVFIGCMYQHYPLLGGERTLGLVSRNSNWSLANRI